VLGVARERDAVVLPAREPPGRRRGRRRAAREYLSLTDARPSTIVNGALAKGFPAPGRAGGEEEGGGGGEAAAQAEARRDRPAT
jgi:hypothetical protein